MCQYIKENKCSITKENCPFMYYCNKANAWRPMNSMPQKCKIQDYVDLPKGWSKVRMQRKGCLYIDIKGQTIKIQNPFDYTPTMVKISKLKNGEWKIREAK